MFTNSNWVKFASILFCLIFTNLSWSNDEIFKSPHPKWVSPVALPEVSGFPKDQIQNGVYYLLLDTQVIVDQERKPQYYRHTASYIANQAGVEKSSQINISYDPSYQHLVLHSLQIIRNGQTFDKTNSARMKLIQREEDMDELIYNGKTTLNIIIDDVRVGDTIEYSYSRKGSNPVYQNIFAYSHSLNWSVPVGKLSLRLLWNKPSPLQYQLERSDLKLTRTETANGSEYLIQGEHLPPVKIENDTPSWFSPWGIVYFSELKTWGEVASWSRPLYSNAIATDDSINRVVTDIRAQNTSVEAQISAALRFVQDEIRYLGIELGQNSHMPTPASETLRNRYGDCKDKTVLLLTLLKSLGVEAYPALVNTESKLAAVIPNIHAFDHVITYIEHDNKQYWVDPTRSYQNGSVESIHQPDYGHALVLRSHTRNLTLMQPTQSKYGIFVKDRFTIPSKGEATYTSETKNHGWNAERQRRLFDDKGRDQMQQSYLEFYQSYYPSTVVKKPLEYKNNTQDNVFITTERYQITDFWQDKPAKKRHEIDFYANSIDSYLNIPDKQKRSQPLYLSHPRYIEQAFDIKFDEDNWDFEDVSFVENNDFFHFSSDIKFDKATRTLYLTYVYQSKTDYVAPKSYSDYLSALKKVEYEQSYGIYKNYLTDTAPNTDTPWYSSYLNIVSVIVLYAILYLVIVLLWRIDRRHNPDSADSIFFPVSMVKLSAMWILTAGIYGAYWFYKNFQYIKEQEKNTSIPIARGFFYSLWYYPLWSNLKEDCDKRFGKSHLPSKVLAIPMALVFLVLMGTSSNIWLLPSLLLSVMLILPLAHYIQFVNGNESQALKENSRWGFRHYFLALISLPWIALSAGSEIGLTPNEAVIKGSRILDYNITLMQRRGILNPGDDIDYFYSDAFLFISEDGNGFTQRHVFSYWKDENDSFEQAQATYNQVQDIQVEWNTDTEANSTITIIKKDGSKFLLFVSNINHKDKVFVSALKERWKNQR